jgi:hypothetical protein
MTDWTIEKLNFFDYKYYKVREGEREICECENLEDAELIVSLHNDGIKALKKAKSYIETITHYQNISPMDVINKVLNKLEEK